MLYILYGEKPLSWGSLPVVWILLKSNKWNTFWFKGKEWINNTLTPLAFDLVVTIGMRVDYTPRYKKVYQKFFLFFFNILCFFSVRLLLVLHGHSGFFIPATSAWNDLPLQRISIPDVIHYIFVLSLFFRKSQYFHYNVEC